jgi:hypothetical protein
MDIERLVEGVTLQARLAAALGALQLPGEELLAELQRVEGHRTGPLRLYTEARLDKLGWALPVHPLAVLRGAEHLPLDHALLHHLLDELRPDQVLLRVDQGSASVEMPCPRLPSTLHDRLAEQVTMPVQAIRVGERELWVRRPCPSAPELVRLCQQVASDAQSRWQGAMHEALGASRAWVALQFGPDQLERVEASYEGVSMETVLRTVLHVHPDERVPRMLGALAAAADADQALLSLVAHPAEPPLVGIELSAS